MMEKLSMKFGNSTFELLQGDITKQDTEAVVNAANRRLAPGGGVAGAIHAAAGTGLWEECKTLGGCKPGEAKITRGHDLPNRFIVHTVGPIYHGIESDAESLRSSYRNSLMLAEKKGIKSIAFPAISTGAFGYPVREAARTALKTIIGYLEGETSIELVRMVLYDERSFSMHKEIFEEITGN